MRHPVPRSIGRILATTDFTRPSHSAVLYAARVALDVGAWLTILHVLPSPNEMIGIVPGASVAEELAVAHRTAEVHMAELEAEVRGLGLPRVASLIDASPATARAILTRAAAEHTDLIVLATHGRSGLPRMVIGSVADVIVRTAACPVLTLRPE